MRKIYCWNVPEVHSVKFKIVCGLHDVEAEESISHATAKQYRGDTAEIVLRCFGRLEAAIADRCSCSGLTGKDIADVLSRISPSRKRFWKSEVMADCPLSMFLTEIDSEDDYARNGRIVAEGRDPEGKSCKVVAYSDGTRSYLY